MHTHEEKKQENKNHSVANTITQKQGNKATAVQFKDNRPEALAQRKMQEAADHYTLQRTKENKTGLPDNLKSGIENLSGYTMDDVRVHYNSGKPAQLQAHAYTQGSDIHVAPGQEKHLPHEAWHVVQQKQGRVKPTLQMKGTVNINDDAVLEKEADVMGDKAMQMKMNADNSLKVYRASSIVMQRFTPLDTEIGTEIVVIEGEYFGETGIIKGISKTKLNTFIIELRSKEEVEIPAESIDPLKRSIEEAFEGKTQINNHFQLAKFMDENFGDKWMFTGSVALKLWSNHFGKPISRGLHDVDIIVDASIYSNVPFIMKQALGDTRARLADGKTTSVNNHGYIIDIFKSGGIMGDLSEKRIIPPGFKVMSLQGLYEKKQQYKESVFAPEMLMYAEEGFRKSQEYKAQKNELDLKHIEELEQRPTGKKEHRK